MAKLSVTVATGDYDRIQAVRSGEVPIEGCDVTYLTLPPGELFYRLFTYREFDIAEMSLSTYMLARSRGAWPYCAIPVFLSRVFPHSSIYVRAGTGIEQPENLKGRTIGVPNYHLTRGLSVRGVLSDEYGISPDDISWRVGGVDRPEDFDYVSAEVSGVDIQRIPRDDHLARQLVDGEIDAIISYRDPRILTDGHSAIRRLFTDFRTVERKYFESTGVFPIMHVVGIRESLLDQNRWLARSVYKAFDEAKARSLARLTDLDALAVTLPWLVAEARETIALMGEDFWPYGIERNRSTLETQTRWSCEQGLSDRQFDVEELFAEPTRTWYRTD
jgi:4,5-dihydroxyphthalate decarboxylase